MRQRQTITPASKQQPFIKDFMPNQSIPAHRFTTFLQHSFIHVCVCSSGQITPNRNPRFSIFSFFLLPWVVWLTSLQHQSRKVLVSGAISRFFNLSAKPRQTCCVPKERPHASCVKNPLLDFGLWSRGLKAFLEDAALLSWLCWPIPFHVLLGGGGGGGNKSFSVWTTQSA